MKKQIFINITSTYLTRGVTSLLGFFLVPFLIFKLRLEAFGLIILFESLMRLLELGSTNIRIALSRYATFALSQDKTQEFAEYLSTGRYMLFILSGFVLVGGLIFSQYVTVFFRIPEHYETQSVILFSTMTVAFVITIPNIVFWSALYAKQRYDLINFSNSIGLVLRAVIIFIAFSILPERYVSLTTYGLVYLAMTWAQNYFIYVWSKRVLPELTIRLKYFKPEKIKEIVSFGVYTLMGHISSVLYDNGVNIMINWLWGPTYNAIYAIGMKFSILMQRLFKEPAWTLTPTFTDLVAKGENAKLKELFFIYTKSLTIVCLPVSIFLMIYAEPIIQLWVGNGYATSARIMVISLIPILLSVPVAAAGNFPNAYAKVKVPSIVDSMGTVFSLFLGYLMAKRLGLGMPGLVLGDACVAILYHVSFVVTYACFISGISLRQFWTQAYLKPMLWAVIVWGGGFALLIFLKQGFESTLVFIGASAILAVLYLAGCYIFVLDKKDKSYVQQLLSIVFAKLGLSPLWATNEL